MKHYYIVLYNFNMITSTNNKIVLFDLDGTLTDSYPAITSSFLYAVNGLSNRQFSDEELSSIIGPPLKDSFMRLLGVNAFDAWELVKKYREFYTSGGMYNCRIYDGVEDLLKALVENGITLVVATSKPEIMAKSILNHFSLDKYFTNIIGDDADCPRGSKSDIINYCLASINVTKNDSLYMVGDRKYDILGAKEFGITTIGVTYGYGSKKELIDSGADYIVNSANEIKELLLNEGI